jgi:signal transduction histidine kinase/ActR/RegA family two-component response regulator
MGGIPTQPPERVHPVIFRRTIPATMMRNWIVGAFAALFLVGGAWLGAEVDHFRKDEATIRNDLLEGRKAELRQRAVQMSAQVAFLRSRAEAGSREATRGQVDQAHATAAHILEKYGPSKSADEVRSMILDALRPVRFNRGRGYLFVFSGSGVLLLNGSRPDLEGRNLWSFRDSRGVPLFREMADLARRRGEGFITYRWPKPGRKGEDFEKFSYVRRFAPCDWVIGAGEYQDDAEASIREEGLSRVGAERFGEDGVVVAGTLSGEILSAPTGGALGPLFSRERGGGYAGRLAERAREGGGFASVADGGGTERIFGYAAPVAGRDWFVAAVSGTADLAPRLERERSLLVRKAWQNVALVCTFLVLLFLGAVAVARHTAARTRSTFETFSSFFREAATKAAVIDPEGLAFDEFRELAGSANRMVLEIRRMEEQAAKMAGDHRLESIGTLAGGIAHDFNNILTSIAGYTEIVLEGSAPGSPERENLERIRLAARRATELVKQILAFSRKDLEERSPVRVDVIVCETLNLLRAAVPSTVKFSTSVACDATVLANPTRLCQVVMNLCTNAAAAMKDEGGTLRVGLSPDPDPSAGGAHVLLTVEDTGCGMTAEVREHIFEPFFTTRPRGEGTGMGLSVVHGIVHALGGTITVASEPGKGSLFTVRLPACDLAAGEGQRDAGDREEEALSGEERVLFVDDEESISDLVSAQLGGLGYRVTPFTDSEAALREFRESPHDFDIVVSDMTMPRLTGDRLAAEIRAIRPDLPVVLCSGFTDRETLEASRTAGIADFLTKPMSRSSLSRSIRRALAERKGA